MGLLNYLGSISNYIGFWGTVLVLIATFYFIIEGLGKLSDKIFGF